MAKWSVSVSMGHSGIVIVDAATEEEALDAAYKGKGEMIDWEVDEVWFAIPAVEYNGSS